MSTQVLNNKIIKKSFSDVVSSLSEKEQNVIIERVGINGERKTLQSIGNSFTPQITRERVRQIEDTGIKKIGRIIKTTLLAEIQDKAREFIDMSGGLMSKDRIIGTLIKELKLEKNVNSSILEVVIQSDFSIRKSKQKLGCEIYFYLEEKISKYSIDKIHKEALKILKKKKDVMEKETLYNMIKENLRDEKNISITLIDSTLDLFEDIVVGEETLIGLSKWRILNPKTLKDKAIYVMKKERTPMHFVDISNKISENLGEKVKVNTIHNELIRNNEFVLIGRGIYALKEFGFVAGTVIDVIVDVLKKNGEAMNTESIIKEVMKKREVKETTIYMNLQNKEVIKRVGRNFYDLK